jgi:isovaleryl-CoA dehydrogenase
MVPKHNVVGGVNQAVSCMMRNLEIERLGLAAMAVGIAKRSLNEMKNYALQRQAFHSRDLLEFGQIQKMIADSYVEYMAGKCYLYSTTNTVGTHLYSNHDLNTLNADGTKLYCAQMSKNISDRAIQVMGGNGYINQYKVERLWRDSKLLEIGGGTNESHHKNISRIIRKHYNVQTPME